MAGNRMICKCNNVDYMGIRMAMVDGARTLDDIIKMMDANTVCGNCRDEIQSILDSVCGCNNISMKMVVKAVKDGATTSQEVADMTGAGAVCQRCRILVDSIIERGA